MATQKVIKDSDPIRHDDLVALVSRPSPTVTMTIPTHRGGAETVNDGRHLDQLIEQARTELEENFPDADADAILAPVKDLRKSENFWQIQVDGLALFAGADGVRYFRTPRDFDTYVHVGEYPDLRTILPLVTQDLEFLLLAVSREDVRLYAADRSTITDLKLGDLPGNEHAVEGAATREPETQPPSRGMPGYGHGDGEENVIKAFLQSTGKALEKRYVNDKRPVVLATLSEYQNTIEEQLHNVQIVGLVQGNPERESAAQLHEAAWPKVEEENNARHTKLIDDLSAALGTGKASNDPASISRAAETGRVETLLLSERTLTDNARAEDLDTAIANTLVNRGHLDVVDELPGGHRAGAIFRY